jgi:hypothetical protein
MPGRRRTDRQRETQMWRDVMANVSEGNLMKELLLLSSAYILTTMPGRDTRGVSVAVRNQCLLERPSHLGNMSKKTETPPRLLFLRFPGDF